METDNDDKMPGWLKASIAAAATLLSCLLFWIFFLNHVSLNEFGVTYNPFTGKQETQNEPGWHITPMWVKATSVSELPFKIEIASNAKVINSKMVKFKKEGIMAYIKLHGFEWGMEGTISNTFVGYAWSGQSWPFLEIIQEANPNTGELAPSKSLPVQ